MRPLYEMLANAGQKVITVSLTDNSLFTSTFDGYDGIIEWIHGVDGSWTYDYSEFDKYITFVESTGINKQINCYSLLPRQGFTYFDKKTDRYIKVKNKPGSPEFKALLRPFLKDFTRHLKKIFYNIGNA